MPRLSTLLVTFASLSASLSTVLSAGTYNVCQYRGGRQLCLTSSGMNQPVRMEEPNNSQQQKWDIKQMGDTTYTWTNIESGCNARKLDINGLPTLFCGSGSPDPLKVTPSTFGGVYHIDTMLGNPAQSRMFYPDSQSGRSVLFTAPLAGPPTEFTITRAA